MMRPKFTPDDEDEALEMALSGLEDEARSHRLGDRMPEGHRSSLVITIAPGEEMPVEEMAEELTEEDEEAVL